MKHTLGTRIARIATPLAAVLAFGATPAHAADIGPLVKFGWDWGHEMLATVTFVNGPSQEVRVNEGLYAGLGVGVVNESRSLEAEFSVSYKAKFVTGDNGQVDWNHIPIDLLAFYRTQNYRFGGGVTYHVKNTLRGTGFALGSTEFKNALGAVLQIDMLFGQNGSIGLRFLKLEYEAKDFDYKAKSDGVGITATMTFW